MSATETMTKEKMLETALRYLSKEGVDVSSISTFTNYGEAIRVCMRECLSKKMLSDLENYGILLREQNKLRYTFVYNPGLVGQ